MFESKAKIKLWVECGDDYYYGRDGETIDYEMASVFYFEAMKKKHPRATYMLGLCYELGRGVETDMEYAEILYEKAAKYGDENAQKRLATGKLPDENKLSDGGKLPGNVERRVLASIKKAETGNKAFWARYADDQNALEQLLKELSLPAIDKPPAYKELKTLLKERRKRVSSDTGDYAALTLALLAIKAKLGGAALFDSKTVRAYLTDLLPNIREMRRLSALVFDTDAIAHLRSEPQKAIRKLKARGLSGFETERLIDCFAAAFAVTVDYEGLPDDSLLAAAEYNDTEALFILALRHYESGDTEQCRAYLQKAVDLGHGPAQGVLESSSLFEREDEDE